MNKIIAAVLSLLISIQPVFSNPLVYPEDEPFLNADTSILWQPVKMEDLRIGDLDLDDVWLLPAPMMVAPVKGYLISRSDWVEIRRMLNHMDSEFERIKTAERAVCDDLLRQKDVDCQELNRTLRETVDENKILITTLTTTNDDLKSEMFYWKIGLGSAVILSLSFGLFAISK